MHGAFVSLVVAALLCGCAGPMAPQGPQLTGNQFKDMIVGKTMRYESADLGYALAAVGGYKSDGTLASEWTSGGKSGHYAGTWTLDGDKVCVTSSAANGGDSACRTWRKVGEMSYVEVNPDGTLHGTSSLMK